MTSKHNSGLHERMRRAFVGFATVTLLAFVATGATQPVGAEETGVSIENLAFTPVELTINVGDTVAWTNNDAGFHTVTEANGDWDSGELDSDQTFRRTFETAGTFNYFCIIHPNMRATLIVSGQSSAAPGLPTAVAEAPAAATASPYPGPGQAYPGPDQTAAPTQPPATTQEASPTTQPTTPVPTTEAPTSAPETATTVVTAEPFPTTLAPTLAPTGAAPIASAPSSSTTLPATSVSGAFVGGGVVGLLLVVALTIRAVRRTRRAEERLNAERSAEQLTPIFKAMGHLQKTTAAELDYMNEQSRKLSERLDSRDQGLGVGDQEAEKN